MARLEAFEVLDPGILTTIQDLGRYGYSRFGIPPSGALDPLSIRIANLLVGNREEGACLEVTVMGLKLKALREVAIAITGGDLSPALNGEPMEMWKNLILVEGDALVFRRLRNGCRAYLAVSGGIDVPEVMGSRSTYLSGRFGGMEGRMLKRGDTLSTSGTGPPLNGLGSRFPKEWLPLFGSEVLLNVIAGPQDDHFTERGAETFWSSAYLVTPQSDRMGIRLEGAQIERRPDVEESIISEGLLPGAIQVPGDGKPMIILTELVTGGYTKIATVISADLPKAGQLKPGDQVRFTPIAIEEAHRRLKAQEDRLNEFRDILRNRVMP